MPIARTRTKTKRTPFGRYSNYVSRLQDLMTDTVRGTNWDKRVVAALDGEANAQLRRLVTLKARRKFGAYFTGTKLSNRLLRRHTSFGKRSFIYDPSCGMCDLLLASAKKLKLEKNLQATLMQWGRQLAGTDLNPEFIEGAKRRLVLLARQRHKTKETIIGSLNKLFPHIKVGDGLVEKVLFQRATLLVMNPPFGRVAVPFGCKWAGGKISEAAIFMVTALERVRPGVKILAILPEVLRSGSFSEHWRNCVSDLAEIHQ